MTGLENIIRHIENDAEIRETELIRDAESEAKRIIDDAVLKTEKITEDFSNLAEKNANETILKAKSKDSLELKKSVLLKKQSIIKTIINEAKENLKTQSPENYFAFCERLIKIYAQEKRGEILLSIKDRELMTKSFKKILNEKNLEISEKSIEDKGFILVYGPIEISCTFDAIFNSQNDKLVDLLNGFLFEDAGGV